MTTNNELAAVKSKMLSIVSALENIDAEKEHIKDIIESLKNDHGIEPKVVRKAAKLLHKNEVQKFNDDYEELKSLIDQLN